MGAEHAHCTPTHVQDRRVLWIALALNFSMFLLELWQGTRADSTSLLADAMDFLSDSFGYLITLYVLTRHLHTRAKASLLKASLMLLLAAFAGAQGAYNILHGQVPDAISMGWVSLLAFSANLTSAALLYGARGRDSNMRSVWLCSRNDALANILVLLAAVAVYFSASLWPDLAAALTIMYLEGSAALRIIRHAREELRQPA